MTDVNWLTVTELSLRLGIPDATLRRYIRHHGHHLKLRKKHKSYNVAVESIDVLVRIREAYAGGHSIEIVEDMLVCAGVPTVITVEDVNSNGDRMTINLIEVLSELQKTVTEQSEMIRSFGNIVPQKQKVDECLTKWRIERRLEREALDLWIAKPKSERMRRIGLLFFQEDILARDFFIRKYVDNFYEVALLEEYGL